MARVAEVETGYYRVPLPEVLSDSTHGTMRAFELLTVRIRDADGGEGVGYTYTVGRNGAAVAATLERDLAEVLSGQDADLIEALWQRMWWATCAGPACASVLIFSGCLISVIVRCLLA